MKQTQTALEQALEYYRRNHTHGASGLSSDLSRCSRKGSIVVITDNMFLLAWPVHSSWDIEDCKAHRPFGDWGEVDAWYVHLLIGNPKVAVWRMENQARRLPYIVFQRGVRGQRLHRIKFDSVFGNAGRTA